MTKSVEVQVKRIMKNLHKKKEGISKEVLQALFLGAAKIQEDAVMSIQRGSKTGKIYKRGGVTHQASAPGEAPANAAGALAPSVRTKKVDDGYNVIAGNSETRGKSKNKSKHFNYAVELEFGTDGGKIAPRPYMQPALEANRKDIQKKITAAIKKEVNSGNR